MGLITCGDCKRPYDSPQPNAKRCTLCRLLRDWLALLSYPRACSDCGIMFLRSHRAQDECPRCDLIYAGLSPAARRARKLAPNDSPGECALCRGTTTDELGRPYPGIHPELRLCTGCAAAPGNLEQVRRAVKRKIRELRALEPAEAPA